MEWSKGHGMSSSVMEASTPRSTDTNPRFSSRRTPRCSFFSDAGQAFVVSDWGKAQLIQVTPSPLGSKTPAKLLPRSYRPSWPASSKTSEPTSSPGPNQSLQKQETNRTPDTCPPRQRNHQGDAEDPANGRNRTQNWSKVVFGGRPIGLKPVKNDKPRNEDGDESESESESDQDSDSE
jgi:hypothetical protein